MLMCFFCCIRNPYFRAQHFPKENVFQMAWERMNMVHGHGATIKKILVSPIFMITYTKWRCLFLRLIVFLAAFWQIHLDSGFLLR